MLIALYAFAIAIAIASLFVLWSTYKTNQRNQAKIAQEISAIDKEKESCKATRALLEEKERNLMTMKERIDHEEKTIKERITREETSMRERIALEERRYQQEQENTARQNEQNLNQMAKNIRDLQRAFDEKKLKFTRELQAIERQRQDTQKELDSLRSTQRETFLALDETMNAKNNPQMFSIELEKSEHEDIETAREVRSMFSHPEIIDKYIWSLFLQKKMKQLATRILGSEKVCGVYKITDMTTQKAYIGQSVNIEKRWFDHVRAACQNDTEGGQGCLLYSAMKNHGYDNFTFEVLCTCDKEELNDKEKYFIDLFATDVTGLNLKAGGAQNRKNLGQNGSSMIELTSMQTLDQE